MGSLSLLQRIFPAQGLNPGLPHCRQILYQICHKGSPRILEWPAYPFSSGSSRPRDWTRVSCIASRFFTNWAIRETRVVWAAYIFVFDCLKISLCPLRIKIQRRIRHAKNVLGETPVRENCKSIMQVWLLYSDVKWEKTDNSTFNNPFSYIWASFVAKLIKNPFAKWETWVQSLGREDPLEKGKATHSNILACRIPWTV